MIKLEAREKFETLVKESVAAGLGDTEIFEKAKGQPGLEKLKPHDVRNTKYRLGLQKKRGRKAGKAQKGARPAGGGIDIRIAEMRDIAAKLRAQAAVYIKHAEFLEQGAARMEAIIEAVDRVKVELPEINLKIITEGP